MQYGFAIDQRTCIGCHACTVACKTEHEVPVGQFRTWVKYVDSGTYPESTRDFGVMRCNHCTDAPCVNICPTNALFKRDDGIVDFDGDSCIGCKSCMQACPYDAIYIDEDTNTAAKCNFCAHRVDEGLEPACVVVCPTHSIWVGDLDDENSGISRLIADNPTQVRSPEQNTGPNVFYLGADEAVLDPLQAPVRDSYIWAEADEHRKETSGDFTGTDPTAATTLNTAHPRPWGWHVITYLWTKGAGAGALFVAALAWLWGTDTGVAGDIIAPILAAAGAAATGGLLIWDLDRPERFYYLFTRPNTGSWLVKGGYCLLAVGAASVAWFIVRIADWEAASAVVGVLSIIACGLGAGYTAFLFGQAEGRDLWQSPWLLPHLLFQGAMVGAGLMIIATVAAGEGSSAVAFSVRVLVIGVVGHVVIALADVFGRHRTRNAQVGASILRSGRYARAFWAGSVGLALAGGILALPAWGGSLPALAIVAAVLVQIALLVHETIYVRAGQDVPLS